MKRLVKNAPTANGYRSDYEPSIGLIEQIAKDTREPYNTVHPGLSANDVLLKLLNGETVKVMNPFGTEVLWTLEEQAASAADVRIMDKGYEVLDTYRGFHIGGKGVGKIGVYKNGESFAMHYLSSVPQARGYIDRLIKSGFIEWFDRYNEARAEKGLNAPADRDRAGKAFRDKRDPEDLALDDLMDASRYTVEQQQDGTWAIFHGGGFVQGGYQDRGEAVFEAKQRIEADVECGVPVIKEVA